MRRRERKKKRRCDAINSRETRSKSVRSSHSSAASDGLAIDLSSHLLSLPFSFLPLSLSLSLSLFHPLLVPSCILCLSCHPCCHSIWFLLFFSCTLSTSFFSLFLFLFSCVYVFRVGSRPVRAVAVHRLCQSASGHAGKSQELVSADRTDWLAFSLTLSFTLSLSLLFSSLLSFSLPNRESIHTRH